MIYAIAILSAASLFLAIWCGMLWRAVGELTTERDWLRQATGQFMATNTQVLKSNERLLEMNDELSDQNDALRGALNLEDGQSLVVFNRAGFKTNTGAEEDDG